jgi:hypothetical protein
LKYYWTFGDGAWSDLAYPSHTYLEPGIYPVTLVVDDGVDRSSFTQHITIDGQKQNSTGLILIAPDEFTFRIRHSSEMDVYGWPVKQIPHTLEFLARPSRPLPDSKIVEIKNAGSGSLAPVKIHPISYHGVGSWLKVFPKGSGNMQTLEIQVDATDLNPGHYSATVNVECPGAANSPQGFRVSLKVPNYPPVSHVTVDDQDPGFYCTPYYWVGHRFKQCKDQGFSFFNLTDGGRSASGEFVRFTPDLKEGNYKVSFSNRTPFEQTDRFKLMIHHGNGDTTIVAQPGITRDIGTFYFTEGTDGYVELHSGGAEGEVLADAVIFSPVED